MPTAAEQAKVVGTPTAMLDREIQGDVAWTGATDLPNGGKVFLTEDCLDEIRGAAAVLEANPLPLLALSPEDFELRACAALMARVKQILEDGPGFVILDRLPLDELSQDMAEAGYWLLGSMLGRPVAQKWNGLMKYDVRDTGKSPAPGNGVRGSVSNAGQSYHTDNSYDMAPHYVALMCLRPAKVGGVSGLVSFQAVHNLLLKDHPDLLPRLYEPFYLDRQREHRPDAPLLAQTPMFRYENGKLDVRFSERLIKAACEMRGEPLDDAGRRALEAVIEIMNAPGMDKEFDFERGQIQIVNNRRLGHRRTAFTDWPEPERRRHLVRLWFRNSGRPFYAG